MPEERLELSGGNASCFLAEMIYFIKAWRKEFFLYYFKFTW